MVSSSNNQQQKTFLVTGGSGFIGRKLCQRLIDSGHHVIVVTRNLKKTGLLFKQQIKQQITLLEDIDQLDSSTKIDVFINLGGEPLAASRWNKKTKAQFVDSRVNMTKTISAFVARAAHKPSVLISGSAIGFYGLRDDEQLTESDPGRACFSHQLCKAWEAEAIKNEAYGVRVCLLRTGMVLGSDGGALASLLPPFKLGLGGRIGNGKQWMSWIHIDDLIGIILFAIENETIQGPINGVSPNPVTNAAFSKTLGKVLHRPVIFPVPKFILKILVGEMAEELLIHGQRVIPEKVLNSGFEFDYPDLKKALIQIINN